MASRRIFASMTLTLLLACGDDGGSTGTEGASTGPTTGSTSNATPTTSGPTPTPMSSTSQTSGTTEDSADSGTTTEPDPTGDSSTTEGLDPMGLTFFVTSVGSGDAGGNLGGLDGADAMCEALADAVGEGARTWQAYLSTTDVDARDRIGTGPWYNSAGDLVGTDVDSLHMDGLSNGDPQHILDENGQPAPGNEHDILTGSQEDGTLMAGSTCEDWTSDSGGDQARVGHSDIPGNPMFSPSWNSAHETNGCGPNQLQNTGGSGRLYCFAID